MWKTSTADTKKLPESRTDRITDVTQAASDEGATISQSVVTVVLW